MEIYLTPELKAYYMDDFNNNDLKEIDPFWKLDDGIKDYLISINNNPNIQTLFSKKKQFYKPSSENDCYIEFCYSQKIEQHIFKTLIPELNKTYNYDGDERLYYIFEFPKENIVYSEKTASRLGCKNNKDFFRVNHIKLTFESWNTKRHDEFWEEIKNRFSIISSQ